MEKKWAEMMAKMSNLDGGIERPLDLLPSCRQDPKSCHDSTHSVDPFVSLKVTFLTNITFFGIIIENVHFYR